VEHKTIGNTGVKIPPVIFGTSALGNLYTALSDETKLSIVRECIKNVPGPVVFDSAGKYGAGLALEELGKILHQLNISPDDVVISNKLGWLRMPLLTPEPTFEKGVWMDIHHDARQSISNEGIQECWGQGNALLGNYRPALVSVHDPDEYLAVASDKAHFNQLFSDVLEAYKALGSLKKAGIIKAVGVGAKDWKTIRLIAGEVELDWVMFANSLTIYRHPQELLDFMAELHKKGVAIINSAVFHAGFLTGGDFFDYVKITPDSKINKSRFMWREDFFTICKKHNVLPANACVQFAMTPPGVISISLNTSNPARVKDNVESVNCKIPHEFWKEMIDRKLIDPDYSYLKL
jgi:D-threo-aldose 1-dehydrogenase